MIYEVNNPATVGALHDVLAYFEEKSSSPYTAEEIAQHIRETCVSPYVRVIASADGEENVNGFAHMNIQRGLKGPVLYVSFIAATSTGAKDELFADMKNYMRINHIYEAECVNYWGDGFEKMLYAAEVRPTHVGKVYHLEIQEVEKL
jgi:hypothetical protein